MGKETAKPMDFGSEYSKKDPSTLRLYLRDFPGVKGMTVGQEVKLEVTAKVVSVAADEWGMRSDTKQTMAKLDIVKVEGDDDSDE